MENLTIGQLLGIHPLLSVIPTRHQYFSKRFNKWIDCHESELEAYAKYSYKIRTI